MPGNEFWKNTKTHGAVITAISSEKDSGKKKMLEIQHMPYLEPPMPFWEAEAVGKWQIIWGAGKCNLALSFLGTAGGGN